MAGALHVIVGHRCYLLTPNLFGEAKKPIKNRSDLRPLGSRAVGPRPTVDPWWTGEERLLREIDEVVGKDQLSWEHLNELQSTG